MSTRSAWVMNLDADRELATPRGYAPRQSVLLAMRAYSASAAPLLGPDDILVDELTAEGAARGFVGRAFSPTPRALTILERVGATIAPHPPLDVLRRVTSRAFSASLGATLPDQAFVRDVREAIAKVAVAPSVGNGWRMKRAFGMAGREHRIVNAGAVSRADDGFLRASIDEGGVMIEPNLFIVQEHAIHGFITEDAWTLGALVVQRTDVHGAWLSTTRVEGEAGLAERLREEADRVASALVRERYVGPFGIDAFSWRDPRRDPGASVLNPRSEVNARYTMGFAYGFGRPP